jgi:hypothetical protein
MKNFIPAFFSIAAVFLLVGCGDKSSPKAAADTNAPTGYLGTLVDEKKSSDKKIDVAYLNQAVQLFNVQEGRYPKTLEELTPNYVAKIPDAPIGFKIDYDPVKGEVKVVAQ